MDKPEKCWKCQGTGIYRWGGSINGVARFSGECFRCQGKGFEDDADKRRNWGYDMYTVIRGFGG